MLLELDGVSAEGDRGVDAVHGVSLNVSAGQILGVAGVAGNGQRELAEAVTGLRPLTAGTIRVGGVPLRTGDPRAAIKAGIAHVPEDRLHTGVAPSLSISSNVVLKSYRSSENSAGPFLRFGRIRDWAVELIHRYDVKAPGPGHRPASCRAGTCRRSFSRASSPEAPRVLVIAAPTRGLDVGAIETVHAHLRAAAASGVAILLISEDLDELMTLSDRIAVMYEGRIMGEVDAATAAVEEIGLMMAGGAARMTIRIERRLAQPHWLKVAVPVGSLIVAFVLIAILLVATGRDPVSTYRDLFEAAFTAPGALSQTLTGATPILFTGLAAAAAFRMNLFNIGGEGQLYFGAIAASAAGLLLAGQSAPVLIVAMMAAGIAAGAAWALIPGILKAYLSTNEIITSLMLNYVAGLFLTYLIFDSHSYWRDTTSASAAVFPVGKTLPDAANWPTFGSSVVVPLGFVIGIVAAILLWVLYSRTRFGFEVQVMSDSPRAARYSGMRTRRKILAVMALSGALAGLGGASQIGDFSHTLDADPNGLRAYGYGYTGIVVAALARYNPFAVVLVAFLLGGLQNAGSALQGPDFPSGLVGVMEGMILFTALGGELLVRYRIRVGRRRHACRRRPPPRARVEQLDPRRRDRLRHRVRHAAALRLAGRAARGALGRAQPRGRGDDAGRRRDGVLGGAEHRRPGQDDAVPRRARRRPRRRRRRAPVRVPRDHAAREPDRLRSRADDLRRSRRPLVLPRQRPRSRRRAGEAPVRARRPLRARGRARSSGRSCSGRHGSSTRRGRSSL